MKEIKGILTGVVKVIKTPSHTKRELVPTLQRFDATFTRFLEKVEQRIMEKRKKGNQNEPKI